MGSFICSISERDWEITRAKGIYGNKSGNLRDNGSYRKFSPSTTYSIIRDLAGMQRSDYVFFHVLRHDAPSSVHGIYAVTKEPFHSIARFLDKSKEVFPYRFLFAPHPSYNQLCKYDANIAVVDFYELIEQRKIWTLATLENEMNIEARSVRKIEGGLETSEIIRLLHRDFRERRQDAKIAFSPISYPADAKPINACIQDIGQYENSIKALLMHKIGQNDAAITNILGSVFDFMNEVFIAQTTRKSIDILCIQNQSDKSRRFTICEVKTDKCQTNSLSQVLYYVDLFKRREVVNISKDIIIGCLIGQRFDSDVIEFSKKRNAQGVNGSIMLIKYEPIDRGKDATFRRIA